jgi:hypothetical protein
MKITFHNPIEVSSLRHGDTRAPLHVIWEEQIQQVSKRY